MEWKPDVCWDADVEVTTSADTNLVAVQLKDYAGNNMKVRSCIYAYIASTATGDVICTTEFDSIVNGTDGEVIELTTGRYLLLISEADGTIDLTITDVATRTGFLILVMPNGKLAGGDDVSLP